MLFPPERIICVRDSPGARYSHGYKLAILELPGIDIPMETVVSAMSDEHFVMTNIIKDISSFTIGIIGSGLGLVLLWLVRFGSDRACRVIASRIYDQVK